MKNKITESSLLFFRENWQPRWKNRILICLILILLENFLGFVINYLDASDACGLGIQNSVFCFDFQYWHLTLWPSLNLAKLQMGHRILAILIAMLLISSIKKILSFFTLIYSSPNYNKFESDFLVKKILISAYVILSLVVLQIFIGISIITSLLNSFVSTTHLLLGILLPVFIGYLYLKLICFQKNFKNN